jgi:hypothetical protein
VCDIMRILLLSMKRSLSATRISKGSTAVREQLKYDISSVICVIKIPIFGNGKDLLENSLAV